MGLSRLDNFLKSIRGTIIYVDPNSLDSTDSIENTGNSLTRPFKTIQRALIESVRFSYQRGQNNDRFNKTTILLYPGDHIVDNRPGYIPTASGTFSARSGAIGLSDLTQWDLDTNFDLTNPDNPLYKLNSIHGGVIVPRGTSIVGMDLRKTKIRPLYVPNPENDNIERSCLFRVTGGCYFWQFTILDSDPNGNCFKDYTANTFVPDFSHHKLAGFEYADGVNAVSIDDDFLTYSTTRTDLDMYYEKVARVYGASSGREIQPDYGDGTIDIQPVIDEYRIVGPQGGTVGISSIRAGDGATPTNTITVNLTSSLEGLSVDTPIQISGVSAEGYDGQYVISTVSSNTEFTYRVQNVPANALPGVTGSTVNLVVDTVTSASPYIFNISLRSVYGMCGLLADGDKATGFKSMVVAQYTGIGLQKDDNAFVRYDSSLGEYKDSTSIVDLHTNSRSRFKPKYENFHIKATNDAFLQLVSVFAIGYAQHFVTENGGDIALNNSNSNFGAKALVSTGYKRTSFSQDDCGYITHIIPPKEIEDSEVSVEFASLDVGVTTSKSAGAGTTERLYLYNQTNQDNPPRVIIDGYHIGAKENEQLNVQVFQSGITTTYSSRIVMPYGPYNSTQSSSEKVFVVGRSVAGINSIVSNTLTLTQQHSFINGETVRIIADNGHLPDGLDQNQVYYVITKESNVGLGSDQIRIAKTLSSAINGSVSGNAIEINNKGGTLSIVSRVSDKNSGDIGHPVQWDTSGYWYINVDSTNNKIYSNAIYTLGVAGLGEATTRSYVTRKPDSRNLIDTLYRVRYVIPKDSSITARPPTDGFILQESGDIIGSGSAEISQLYSSSGSISNSTQLRNPKFIANATWSSNSVTVTTEIRHNLKVGDQVQIVNVLPTGYNGTYEVSSVTSAKKFTYALTTNPGTFANNTADRSTSLPYVRRKKYNKTYQVYRTQEIQPYVSGVQDGVYYLTLINHSNYPTVTPFREEGFSQPVESLYPQTNTDNPSSDQDASVSHALPDPIGKVVVNDLQNSITKETLESFVGFGITNIRSSSGTAHTIYTSIDHALAGITSLSIVSGGSAYGSSGTFTGSLYNAELVGFAGSTTGSNATAKITIGAGGSITAIQIIDGGSAYGIGNTLTVVGVATTTSHVIGVVRVESISDSTDDVIKVSGVSSALYSGYNTLYRVSGISVGKPKEISVISSETISSTTSSGIGSTLTSKSAYVPTGKVLSVSSLTYDSVTGLATVGFTTSHGFRVDNKIRVGGSNESVFNGDFIVKKLNSLTSLIVNVGIETSSTSATGTLYVYRPTLTSYAGDLVKDTENTSGRLVYEYAGITTTLGSQITLTSAATNLNIPNAVSLGLTLGDYLLINNEIFRIVNAVTSNTVEIIRSILGSPRQTHVTGSVVRRIKVTPVELRRNSIIRASGHTFEYLGFGPGNYSTSLPDKQDRALSSSEKFLAQSTKSDGGIVVYTGMNSDGDFFAGNKKINSATGKEESFETPVPTTTGEKEFDSAINVSEVQKLFVTGSLKVDGGRDNNLVSEFDGPVVFTNKLTSSSDIEANSFFVQGNEEVSRKISILNTKPTISGNYGDIFFNSEPSKYEFVGWTYVTENKWEPFGWIGYPGVGISSSGNYVGFATLIDLVTNGISLGVDYDNLTGISTLTLDADPRIGISSGVFNTFVGLATQINFVGYGVTVRTDYSVSGIATVTIIGSPSVAAGAGSSTTPGLPDKSVQYNNSGSFGGVSIFTYNDVNNNLLINGSSTSPLLKVTQTGSGDCLVVEDQDSDSTTFVVTNNGTVGIGSSVPTAKVDINAEGSQAINIRSTLGSGNIIRVDDTNNDTSPLVYTASGSLGLGTATPNEKLDTIGNIGLNGALRLYNIGRTAYSALQAPTSPGNLTFTLPNSYGSSGQVLTSNGAGTLSWTTVSGGGGGSGVTQLTAGLGIAVSPTSGTGVVQVSNTGVRSLIAGIGITISGSTGDITISASTSGSGMYPFTTRGFSMPI
jgi:hypothetical protein